MTCVSPRFMTHKLGISSTTKPVQQKKRKFALKRNQTIKVEVDQLFRANILFEVKYPTWLENPVMVKKHGGGWRMCIDFIDLNKNCLKDFYPLPSIDQKIESVAGYRVLSFLDLYKGYHQVLMHPPNASKTVFITNWVGVPIQKDALWTQKCRKTYQRMVDQVFQHQVRRNIEVYVNDIIIKSRKMDDFADDLEEMLTTLREVDFKLNPAKCTFGVGSGKFLGYIVSHKELRANPKKTQAIEAIRSPKSIREIQTLHRTIFVQVGRQTIPVFPTSQTRRPLSIDNRV